MHLFKDEKTEGKTQQQNESYMIPLQVQQRKKMQ